MKTIGVVGSGVMGIGVGHDFAQAGYKVILHDISESQLNIALEKIKENLKLYSVIKKTKKADIPAIVANITFTTDIEKMKDADFVVENVTENWDIKKEVYPELDRICKPGCIFGVNTSAISITRVSSIVERKDKIIGIHFMNPVPLKDTVEVIKGFHTSDNTVETTKEVLADVGKKAVVVNDLPGFVSNRISHLFMNEAAYVVQDQVAKPEDVDEIFKKCFGHKMGPLETADLIGLDTVVDSLDVLYQSYQDSKFRCCPMLRKMVHAGLLGKKSGRGFYQYD